MNTISSELCTKAQHRIPGIYEQTSLTEPTISLSRATMHTTPAFLVLLLTMFHTLMAASLEPSFEEFVSRNACVQQCTNYIIRESGFHECTISR